MSDGSKTHAVAIADGLTASASEMSAGGRLPAVSSRALLAALVVMGGYYLGAKIGLALTYHPHPISTLWPPNALLLAALLLTPTRWWWLLVLAAFPAHLAAELQSGVPMAMVLGWFVSNCSEALIGAACLRRLVPGPVRFDTIRDVGVFLVFGGFVAPLLSTFLDAGIVKLVGWGEGGYWHLWRMRFFSNILAALTVVPLVVTWFTVGLASLRRMSFWRFMECGLLFLGLLAVGIVVFEQQNAGPMTAPALFYAPLPFLLWAAVRFGPAGTSAALAVVVMLAIWGAIHGQGPFVTSSPEDNARAVQLFLIAVAIPLLLLAAVIEEHGKAREDLELSERRSAQTFRSSPYPLAIVRQSDHSIVDVNDRWEAMYGIPRAEAVGRTTAELQIYVTDNDRCAFLEALAAYGTVRDKEADMRDRAGRVHQAVLSADAVTIGGVPCIITITRDITEQRRAERAWEEQRQQLTHLNRVAMLGELSGALAHELNQPLTAILSNAQAAQHLLAADRIDLGELREILRDIAEEDRRAGAVIHRLHALFKNGETHFQRLDANDLVNDVLHLARGDLITRGIGSVAHLSTGLPPVRGDRVQLQQVLLNLVMNACDAMSAGDSADRMLIIRTQAQADANVRLEVSDSGPGIPGERLDKLFDPFFTTKQKGLGLGLSISHSIVTAHSGRLWAQNNADRGATFCVVLPVFAGLES
jgi:PAS domain S-box-containing protein